MPFSFWLGQLILKTDIRRYGDGNPGAINAWRAGGLRSGAPALLLDYSKAALPVGIAHQIIGLDGWGLLPVALAPIVGHAFSPFLRFRGGKAVASTFGTWTGLNPWEAPTFLGVFFSFFFILQSSDAWSVILGMACFICYLLFWQSSGVTMVIVAGNMAILVWKHHREMRQFPKIRPWIFAVLKRCL